MLNAVQRSEASGLRMRCIVGHEVPSWLAAQILRFAQDDRWLPGQGL